MSTALDTSTAVNETKPIRIVLADDHVLVRQGIRAFLETEPDFAIVGEAGDSDAAVALCQSEHPDVALLDLVMPGGGGVAATRGIKSASPNTAVVILTSFDNEASVLPALKAGALSYLLKDVAADDLATAVRRAARNEATLHPRVAARVVHALREPEPSQDSLSEREREVLLLIAEGLANQQIATRLGIGEKTVKTHVSNILAKLGLSDRTQVAVWAWRHGLMQDPQP
jgi:NarL family two-component system response regulator LiaR